MTQSIPHTTPELPNLPQDLINTIGEYGMARTDKVSPIELTHRWELLIAGIKDYAASVLAATQAVTAAPQEGVSQPKLTKTAPERIYLVVGEDAPEDTDFNELSDSDITWCADKIDTNSIAYVRADLRAPEAPQPLAPSRESQMVVLQRDEAGKATIWCDPEIADLVKALNDGGLTTVASCSGHGKAGVISLADGRELIIAKDFAEARRIEAAPPTVVNGELPQLLTDVEAKSLQELAEAVWADLQKNELGGYSGINRPFYLVWMFKTVIERYGHRDVGLQHSKNALDEAFERGRIAAALPPGRGMVPQPMSTCTKEALEGLEDKGHALLWARGLIAPRLTDLAQFEPYWTEFHWWSCMHYPHRGDPCHSGSWKIDPLPIDNIERLDAVYWMPRPPAPAHGIKEGS